MKKRLISLALTLCMLAPLLPSALAASTDGNDTQNTATALPLNTAITGNLSSVYDKDYYKFSLSKNDVVSLVFNFTSGNPYMVLALYDGAANKKLADWNFTRDSEVYPSTTNRFNLPAGDYYVLVSSYGSGASTADYSITAKAEFNGNGVPATHETEWNDAMNTADSLPLNTATTGNLSSSYDKDYYKFTLSRNDVVSLVFNFTSGNPYMVLALYNGADNKKLGDWNFTRDSEVFPSTTNRFNLPAGDYYVLVSSYGSGSLNGDYTITAKAEFSGNGVPAGYETEWNDTANTANSLPLNTTATGSLSSSYDKDFYKFTTTKNEKVSMVFGFNDGIPYMTVTLYNQQNKEVDDWSFTSGSVSFPYTADGIELAAGDYYLRVASYGSGSSNSDYTVAAKTAGGAVTPPTTTPPTTTPPVTIPGGSPNPTDPAAAQGASSWAKGEVETAITLGFVPAELQYNYQANITRQEFCKLIVQMLMAKSSTLMSQEAFIRAYNVDLNQTPFSDSSDQYVKIAYALQIVNGTGSGKFSPNNSITRQEAASMLQRAAAVFQFTEYKGSATAFSDKGSLASWASASVDFVSANGIMGGSGGAFDPHGYYSREQSILTALRLFNAFPRSSYAV